VDLRGESRGAANIDSREWYGALSLARGSVRPLRAITVLCGTCALWLVWASVAHADLIAVEPVAASDSGTETADPSPGAGTAPVGEQTTPPAGEAPPPVDEAPPPVDEAPPPVDEAPPPVDEAPPAEETPPAEEAPPPVGEPLPPVEEMPPPATEAPPEEIPPTPPILVEEPPPPPVHTPPEDPGGLNGKLYAVPVPTLSPYEDVLGLSALGSTLETFVPQAARADARESGGQSAADKKNRVKELRAPPGSGPSGISHSSPSGGLASGASGGFSVGVLAALLALLLLAPQGLGGLLGLSVAQPPRVAVNVQVERPG
jgi:hypothetical protein